MSKENLEYYERRARDETAAAVSARSIEAASAHRLLAIEYNAQARELRARLEGIAVKQDRHLPSGEGPRSRPKLSIRTGKASAE
ncbi:MULTISPECIES: hypothetical protein [Sphingomonas]|uniref:hypothetical protein n=1 Tax=Sphingomonas TaxID=13687 RepID=UPI0013DF5311|nr:hypothetical protein [Sphingomonas sp. ABOLF]GLK20538.1 hypothetical protein GCM10017606_13640 [Microbacterium terregens]